MEPKNPMMIIVIIVITILVGTSLMFGIVNVNLNDELLQKNADFDSINNKLNDNITKLQEMKNELNQSNKFFNTYLKGLGSYYNATKIQEKADYKFDQAENKYDAGHLSNALAWYWDASDWYYDAWVKLNDTKKIFEMSSNYEVDIVYINVSSLYSDIVEASANAMIYAKEAADLYADSCEYYLENNYNEAHNSQDAADLKILYHNQELEKVEGYQEDLNTMLIQI